MIVRLSVGVIVKGFIVTLLRGRKIPHTVLSWNKKLMSLGRLLLLRTNCSSPGGRSFLLLPVSMLCKLTHTLSTLCTGLHPCLSSRSRQMMPLE